MKRLWRFRKFYYERWRVGVVGVFCNLAKVVSAGFWNPLWSIRAECRFLDMADEEYPDTGPNFEEEIS